MHGPYGRPGEDGGGRRHQAAHQSRHADIARVHLCYCFLSASRRGARAEGGMKGTSEKREDGVRGARGE